MKLLSSAIAVWWVMERVVPHDGLELCVGAALFISVCYMDLCTKMCVKNRWWTFGSYLVPFPNPR
jgi:hypothetical protein